MFINKRKGDFNECELYTVVDSLHMEIYLIYVNYIFQIYFNFTGIYLFSEL